MRTTESAAGSWSSEERHLCLQGAQIPGPQSLAPQCWLGPPGLVSPRSKELLPQYCGNGYPLTRLSLPQLTPNASGDPPG